MQHEGIPHLPEEFEQDDEHDDDLPVRAVVAVALAVLLVLGLLAAVRTWVLVPHTTPTKSMEHTLECGDWFLVDVVTLDRRDPERLDVVVFTEPPPETLEGDQAPGGGPDGGEPAGGDEPAAGGNLPEGGDEPAEAGELPEGGEEPTEGSGMPEGVEEEEGPGGPGTGVDAELAVVKRVIGLPGETVAIQDGRVTVDGEALREPYAIRDRSNMEPVVVPEGTYVLLGDNRGDSRDSREFGPVDQELIVGLARWIVWPPSRIGALRGKDAGEGEYDPEPPSRNASCQ